MVIDGPMNMTVTVPETLLLNCTGLNNDDAPNPLEFIWSRNSVVLNPRANNVEIVNTPVDNVTVLSQLMIDMVEATDRGTYVCAVTNRNPVEDRVDGPPATVTVQCKCHESP